MPKSKEVNTDPTLAELVAIKRLLVFALLSTGANQDHVAVAAGVSQSSISRMFAGGFPKAKGK